MNQDGNPNVSEDEFVGFLLACVSEEIASQASPDGKISGKASLPVGLRNMIDLKK